MLGAEEAFCRCDEVGAFLGCETDDVGLRSERWEREGTFPEGFWPAGVRVSFSNGMGRSSAEESLLEGRKFSHTDTGLGRIRTSAMTLTRNLPG